MSNYEYVKFALMPSLANEPVSPNIPKETLTNDIPEHNTKNVYEATWDSYFGLSANEKHHFIFETHNTANDAHVVLWYGNINTDTPQNFVNLDDYFPVKTTVFNGKPPNTKKSRFLTGYVTIMANNDYSLFSARMPVKNQGLFHTPNRLKFTLNADFVELTSRPNTIVTAPFDDIPRSDVSDIGITPSGFQYFFEITNGQNDGTTWFTVDVRMYFEVLELEQTHIGYIQDAVVPNKLSQLIINELASKYMVTEDNTEEELENDIKQFIDKLTDHGYIATPNGILGSGNIDGIGLTNDEWLEKKKIWNP